MVSPLAEIAVHSYGGILDGQDNESTIALLALCISLALGLASFVWFFCAGNREETPLTVDTFGVSSSALADCVASDRSPPLILRV